MQVQSQQDILAAQVAQMRAAAKLGQTAAPPGATEVQFMQ